MPGDFLGPVIAKLASLLADEATLLDGVNREVKSLSEKLAIIQRLLLDAEAKPLTQVYQHVKSLKDELESIQTAIKGGPEVAAEYLTLENEIKSQTNRAEEAVEGYRRHLTEIGDDHNGSAGSLEKTGLLILSLKPRLEIADEIKSIQQALCARLKGTGLGTKLSKEHGLTSCLKATSISEKARADDRAEEIVGTLVEGLPPRSVVSLVGNCWIQNANGAKKAFDDLPSFLRPCLLYFGIFPEDFYIKDERLYRLWIAEGFVEDRGEAKTAEEVAAEYLGELFMRNLVSREESMSIGEGNWYRVHSWMRDFVQSRVDELHLSKIRNGWTNPEFQEKGRCLTISGIGNKNSLKNSKEFGVLRSLFLYGLDDSQLAKDVMASFFEKSKFLEVLDVENSRIESLPKEFENLFWLKYLSLRNTKVTELPKVIGKLRNLQSLDIRDSSIRELPIELNKLKKLRHILAYSNNPVGSNFTNVTGVKVQEVFMFSEELQTLVLLEANPGGVPLMKVLEKLRKLRWLGVSNCTKEIGPALCAAIEKMSRLERLYLSAMNDYEFLDVQHVSTPLHFLREIFLTGWLEKLPQWIAQLPNLTGLSLMGSKLVLDPTSWLASLPNLESLAILSQAYHGEQLYFRWGSFPKLRKLSIESLFITSVMIEYGALPVLENLSISNCFRLQAWPNVQYLSNLKTAWVNGTVLK